MNRAVKTIRRSPLWLLPLATVYFWCMGCDGPGAAVNSANYRGPVNTCVSDKNCTEGYCDDALSICVVAEFNSRQIFAKVVFNTLSMPSQLPELLMDTESGADYVLQIKNPIAVTGISTTVDAEVLFTDVDNTLPNTAPAVYVYKAEYADNEMRLLPGEYDVTMYPSGDAAYDHPVYHVGHVVVQEDGSLMQNDASTLLSFPVEVRDTDTDTDVTKYGWIKGGVDYVNDVEGVSKANDLHIQAFDLESGVVLSRERELLTCPSSTTGTSVCRPFSIPMLAETSSIGLRLFKPNEPFYPASIRRIEQVNLDDKFEFNYDISVYRLDKPVLVSGEVTVSWLSAGATPAPRCRVLIEWVNDESRELAYWVETNERGAVQRGEGAEGVYLYPGEYRITAYPIHESTRSGERYTVTEMESHLWVSSEPFEIEADTEAQVNDFSIQLEERLAISGEAQIDDELVPMATVTAFNIETEQLYAKSSKSVSDESGAFSMWLDNAIYYVTTQAPAQSNYAVGTSVWNVRQSKTYTFTGRLRIPFRLAGKLVFDTEDQTTQNINWGSVSIEWYKQFGQNVYLVARSSLGSDGSFYALLPPN